MKKILIFFLLFLSSFISYSELNTMDLNEIKKGMQGKGYTVISAKKREVFYFEVLGFIDSENSINKNILIKTYGKVLEKTNGILEGMSGSPLYINGKLIGVLAYALEEDTSNIAIVTPIEDIFKIPLNFDYKDIYFENIYPGMPISISPIRGDISMENIGTLSFVNKNYFYALGHSFNNKGNIRYFLNSAYIDYSVNSKKMPFKLGHSLETIGMITSDTKYGVGGFLKKNIEKEDLYKFIVNISDEKNKETYKFEMPKNENTLSLYFSKALDLLFNKALLLNNYSRVFYEYYIYNEGDIVFRNSFIIEEDETALSTASTKISSDILSLLNNKFKKFDFDKMILKFEILDEKRDIIIKDVKVINPVINKNEKIKLQIEYYVYNVGEKYINFEFDIPENIKIGNYNLEIFDCNLKENTDFSNLEEIPEMSSPYSYNELILSFYNEIEGIHFEKRINLLNNIILENKIRKKIVIDTYEAEDNSFKEEGEN